MDIKETRKNIKRWILSCQQVENKALRRIILFAGLALTPLYFLTLILLFFYRVVCHMILKFAVPEYRGLLSVLELLFASQRGVNNGVINVYAQLKLTTIDNGEELCKTIMRLAKPVISTEKYEKAFFQIHHTFGLKHWRLTTIDFEKQFRLYDVSNSKEADEYISRIVNEPIRDNKLWEVHVSRNIVDGKHPVIVRLHHSAGDGYAFRQVFLDAQPQFKEPDVLNDTGRPQEFIKFVKKTFFLGIDLILMLILAPSLCILQYFDSFERNSLKTYNLSGRKQLGSKIGDFEHIRRIKNETKSSVTTVFLSALSKSLDDMFKGRHEAVSDVSVSYAMRTTQETSGMENEFLPVALRLPVAIRTEGERLNRVKATVKEVQERPNFMNNYQLPKFALALLPNDWPDWVYRSTDMTVLFSNMPGPKKKIEFDEFIVEEFTFYMMNLQAYNGCGVMMTSYEDKCIYSVILDDALAMTDHDAQKIVDGMIEYVEQTYRKTERSNKRQSLNRRAQKNKNK